MRHRNTRLSRIAFLLAILIIVWMDASVADNDFRKIGLSASIQGGQMDIMIPFWLNEETVLIPALGIAKIEDFESDLILGLAIRVNVKKGIAVPYVGGRFAALVYVPEERNNDTDFIGGPFCGGEYFLNDKFSLGVEAQLNITNSDKGSFRFGNPGGLNYNTASAVFATFYF